MYRHKYLKYKQKYLELKKGGNPIHENCKKKYSYCFNECNINNNCKSYDDYKNNCNNLVNNCVNLYR